MVTGPSLVLAHAHLWSPRWLKHLEPTPIVHARYTLSPESLCMHREKKSSHSHPTLPHLAQPNNGTLFSGGQRSLLQALCRGTALSSPIRLFHTANSSPLPITDLQSLSFSTETLPEYRRLWCPGWWYQWSVQFSL